MNILMFTMTMLMLLATMTYARLDSFLTLQTSNKQFEHQMQKSMHTYSDEVAEERYKKIITKPKVTPAGAKTPPKQSTGIAKLSWSILLNAQERNQDPSKFKKITELSKKLILQLFEHQQTVQKMIEDKPDILDRLFLSLIKAVDKAATTAKNVKLTNLSEIASLDLDDPELNLLRYELLKENPLLPELKSKKKETYSLLDHLTHKQGKTRIYLASLPLLRSIFNQDEAVVKQIVEKRKGYYREVNNGKMTNEEASQLFENEIKALYSYFDADLFECSVTKTDPKTYE